MRVNASRASPHSHTIAAARAARFHSMWTARRAGPLSICGE